ncbi:hypothetical protein GJ496_011763 [Pomphorhynchus laevis]|nr:hypothetical protein GJ496_011763 [Pomphorhynchus laevis]
MNSCHLNQLKAEDSSTYSSADEDIGPDEIRQGVLREQDRFLPIANVAKIMKKAVPNKGKVSKEAKECVQECASEFISFIASEAADRCQREKRKTINGEDLIFALQELGFDYYFDPIRAFLHKYRELVQESKPLVCSAAHGMMQISTDRMPFQRTSFSSKRKRKQSLIPKTDDQLCYQFY